MNTLSEKPRKVLKKLLELEILSSNKEDETRKTLEYYGEISG